LFNFEFSVYGHMYVSRHTYTRVLKCSHASVELAQARPKYLSYYHYCS